MKNNTLPKFLPDALKRLPHNARKGVALWLGNIKPVVPFDSIHATCAVLKSRRMRVDFEMLHSEKLDGRLTMFRTGTVTLHMSTAGVIFDFYWMDDPFYAENRALWLRPLWLAGQFWDAIPLGVKMDDPDYMSDPFDGFADFKPLDGFGYEGMF